MLSPTHLFSYEDIKFELEEEIWDKGEDLQVRLWEEEQDSGVVEDFLEFNQEHIRI